MSTETSTIIGDMTGAQCVGILPQTAATPLPYRRIAFLKALLLFWLTPRRIGPHVSTDSLRRAFAAHAVCLLVAILAAIVSSAIHDGPIGSHRYYVRKDLPFLESLRWCAADTILDYAEQSARSPLNGALVAALFIGALPLLQLAMVLNAVMMMPYLAAGDKTSSVFARSLKITYWSSTTLLPLSLLAVATAYAANSETLKAWGITEEFALAFGGAIGFIVLAFGLRASIVAGYQYVGLADGPAFTEREPCCESCGYIILGLPISARCPECGANIADSLPGGRRKPTLWQEQGIRPRGVRDLLRLHAAVLRSSDPLTRVPVHSALKAARHFWWVSYTLMVLVLLGLLRFAAFFEPTGMGLLLNMAPLCITLALFPFLLQACVAIAACLWSQFRHGIRDYRVSAIICYYACPLQWPLLLVLLAAGCILGSGYAEPLSRKHVATLFGIRIDGVWLVAGASALLALTCIAFWFRRLSAALAAARFANV